VRISVVHWADNGQQSMGIPFRQSDNIKSFINRLRGLQRQYIGLACPSVAMKWAVRYAICNVNEPMCAKRMSTSAIVHATQSAVTPPLMVSTTGTIEGIAPGSGTVATADPVATKDVLTANVMYADDTFVKQALARRRRAAELSIQKEADYLFTDRTALYASLTVATKCCVSCFDGKACGDSCIDDDMQCKIVGGCACNAVPTPNTLYKAGTYVIAKQGTAANTVPADYYTSVYDPDYFTNYPTHSGYTCGCIGQRFPPGNQYSMPGYVEAADTCSIVPWWGTASQPWTGTVAQARAHCENSCNNPNWAWSSGQCGYSYGEYSAELGYRSNANGGATVVVIATDGNPAPAAECSTTDAGRMEYIQYIKQHADRIVPVGIGSHVDVGTLLTLSKGMPDAMPYVTTSFGSLSSALDILATLSCPTQVRCSFLLFALSSFAICCSLFFCLLIYSVLIFLLLPNAGADGAADRRADE
jgi:hypothetical protein